MSLPGQGQPVGEQKCQLHTTSQAFLWSSCAWNTYRINAEAAGPSALHGCAQAMEDLLGQQLDEPQGPRHAGIQSLNTNCTYRTRAVDLPTNEFSGCAKLENTFGLLEYKISRFLAIFVPGQGGAQAFE